MSVQPTRDRYFVRRERCRLRTSARVAVLNAQLEKCIYVCWQAP